MHTAYFPIYSYTICVDRITTVSSNAAPTAVHLGAKGESDKRLYQPAEVSKNAV